MLHQALGLLFLLVVAQVHALPKPEEEETEEKNLATLLEDYPELDEVLAQLGVEQDALDALKEAAEKNTPLDKDVAEDIVAKINAAEDEDPELVGGFWSKLKDWVKKTVSKVDWKTILKDAGKAALKQAIGK